MMQQGKEPGLQFDTVADWLEANTNSTDYEDRGYWAVYTANLFARAKDGKNIIDYTDKDMAELLARVNDRTEHRIVRG